MTFIGSKIVQKKLRILNTLADGVVFRNIFIDSLRKKNHLVGGIRTKV